MVGATAIETVRRRKDGALAYADGANWEERNTDLLQTLLVDTIDRQGGVRVAIRAGDGSANVELHWDVAAFEVDEDHGLQAVFRTTVKLFDARTRQLISSMEFDETAPLSDRSARIAAGALETAARGASARIAATSACSGSIASSLARSFSTGKAASSARNSSEPCGASQSPRVSARK